MKGFPPEALIQAHDEAHPRRNGRGERLCCCGQPEQCRACQAITDWFRS